MHKNAGAVRWGVRIHLLCYIAANLRLFGPTYPYVGSHHTVSGSLDPADALALLDSVSSCGTESRKNLRPSPRPAACSRFCRFHPVAAKIVQLRSPPAPPRRSGNGVWSVSVQFLGCRPSQSANYRPAIAQYSSRRSVLSCGDGVDFRTGKPPRAMPRRTHTAAIRPVTARESRWPSSGRELTVARCTVMPSSTTLIVPTTAYAMVVPIPSQAVCRATART